MLMLPQGVESLLPWLVAILSVSVIAAPTIIGWSARWALQTRWARHATRLHSVIPARPAQFFAFLGYCSNYLLIGFGFYLIAKSAGLGSDLGYAQLTAVFALSWLAGFLSPGMPAGLGAREGVMALMLGGTAAQGELLGAILAMRIATVAGDLGWFFLGSFFLSSSKGNRDE